VAGLVPTYTPDAGYHGTSAALEFGVRVLKVARIAVLGHALCGGIRAMVEGVPGVARDFVEPWMRIAEPALDAVPRQLSIDDMLHSCELEVVRLSLANLATFPWIAEAVSAGQLTLQGFRFDIRSGVLTTLVNDRFVPVS
jgi:carbonic anhydrase